MATRECVHCEGTGLVATGGGAFRHCPSCHGDGRAREEVQLQLQVRRNDAGEIENMILGGRRLPAGLRRELEEYV